MTHDPQATIRHYLLLPLLSRQPPALASLPYGAATDTLRTSEAEKGGKGGGRGGDGTMSQVGEHDVAARELTKSVETLTKRKEKKLSQGRPIIYGFQGMRETVR